MNGEQGDIGPDGRASIWRTIMLIVMGLAGAIVLVAIIVTLGEANRQRDRALQLQSHSYDVMVLARTLASTIARSEASLGRYVISSDKRLGQLYFDDWRLAGTQINRLDRLTRDNTDQLPRISRLRQAYATRGAELSLIALSTNYGKNNQALSRYYAARDADALVEIGDVLDEIIARERILLARRTADAMTTVDRSSWAAQVLSVFGILIVVGAIVLGWLTVRATGERAIAQAEAQTERNRAEELALAVAAATHTLRAQAARIHQGQKMEAVGQLTGGIAHDFNNMLAVVLGGLELARRALGAQATDATRHIDNATEGANRAAALTRRLLAFAREEAINPEPIAGGAIVAGVRDLLDRTLGDGVVVTVIDDSRGWMMRADRVQLENTLVNLAVNARDAMDGRGTLTIRTAATTLGASDCDGCEPGDYLAISVGDTGSGMTPDVVARVFEPFFTTKPVGKGTGLGLSQIFGFVHQLGGGIAIESTPGEGTIVTLYLPRDAEASARIDPVAEDTAPPAPTGSLLVLVVEDDPRVLAATVDALEEIGHHVIACDDPIAAPALLDRHLDIDLILTDVLMPTRTGPEMIAALPPRHAHVAVLYVTGFAGEAGGSGDFAGRHVLRKPFTLAKLEKTIASAMASERAAPPDRIAAE